MHCPAQRQGERHTRLAESNLVIVQHITAQRSVPGSAPPGLQAGRQWWQVGCLRRALHHTEGGGAWQVAGSGSGSAAQLMHSRLLLLLLLLLPRLLLLHLLLLLRLLLLRLLRRTILLLLLLRRLLLMHSRLLPLLRPPHRLSARPDP